MAGLAVRTPKIASQIAQDKGYDVYIPELGMPQNEARVTPIKNALDGSNQSVFSPNLNTVVDQINSIFERNNQAVTSAIQSSNEATRMASANSSYFAPIVVEGESRPNFLLFGILGLGIYLFFKKGR